ncbi:MAG TPA: YdcF family protein [Alphaproteobacteria bacterium]|nr:YdcF family protein [Alphaproteobacteria bacterium]
MSFVLSKVFWVFASPGNVLVLLLVLGAFLATSHNVKRQGWGRKLCFDIAFIFFFISVFPVGDWAIAPLENRFPMAKPDHVDGIILLGGDEKPYMSEKRGQPVMYQSARRYIEFAALAREYPQAKLVFTGGSGLLAPEAKIEDMQVAKQALSSIGVPIERMVFEDKSRNTYENATKSFELLHPAPTENWLLVTSAWHMPRSMECFRKAGWNVYPAPTDYMSSGVMSWKPEFNFSEHIFKLNIAVHEYYGLISYKLMKRIDSAWPK